MQLIKFAAAGLAFATLGACASMSPPDYHAALLAPCEDTADTMPWLLVDTWDDGDVPESETQFRGDGVMIYAYDGSVFDNGRWSLEGTALHLDTNNHYADYTGVFDGGKASGTMKNEPGDTGTWTLARDCKG